MGPLLFRPKLKSQSGSECLLGGGDARPYTRRSARLRDGEGRNSIYLAQLGWEVWGFDPAAAAVRLANQRAAALGLTLHTASVADDQFTFGKDRFDLILFSWAMPLIPVERVLAALKPGGMVVMEAAADYVGRNGMLKMFDVLEIRRYEIVHEKADFYERQEVDIVRLVAVKR